MAVSPAVDTPPQPPPEIEQRFNSTALLLRLMCKRRTWVCLFVSAYTLLLFLSWNFLKSVPTWYEFESAAASPSGNWAALYASLLLGVAFGMLSMVAALAVAVPATLVTWVTVLVLLTFCGKPRKTLVVEGKRLTAEITGFGLTHLSRLATSKYTHTDALNDRMRPIKLHSQI